MSPTMGRLIATFAISLTNHRLITVLNAILQWYKNRAGSKNLAGLASNRTLSWLFLRYSLLIVNSAGAGAMQYSKAEP